MAGRTSLEAAGDGEWQPVHHGPEPETVSVVFVLRQGRPGQLLQNVTARLGAPFRSEPRVRLGGVADRILLVEDDLKLARVVCEFLTSKGFEVRHEATGAAVIKRVSAEPPDLIVLDVLLPVVDGLEICRVLRPTYSGPIIMLTALGDEVDEILGLELGADDYLAKPVRPRVLLARIHALLRRSRTRSSAPSYPPSLDSQPIAVGTLYVDPTTREARFDDRQLQLTTAEFGLLYYLAQRAGHVVDRESISRDLRGIEWDGLDRTIDIRITRLRRKLGDHGKNPGVIKSVRGQGYILVVRK